VKRDAAAAQIKAAYFQLARTYHPDAGPPAEPPEVKKLRADVFGRLGEAWRELSDDSRRAEYLRQLSSGAIGQVDVSAIFKAEELFTKATVLVRARQYPAAQAALAEAIQLNPDEAEFGVWAAWVSFLTAEDRKRQQAESSAAIEAALRKVPRCMPAYLFLGLMAKNTGDLSLAEKQLQRGLALAPDHADLLRELKFLRK
jgi:curved DNA-binding protein CbpA